MRNILKLYSGTQSGTPNPLPKSMNFDGFWCGRKNIEFFVPKLYIKNLVKNLQIFETWIFLKLLTIFLFFGFFGGFLYIRNGVFHFCFKIFPWI